MSGDLHGHGPLHEPRAGDGQANAALDHRTDLYSLGATLYEVLTGEPPFRGKDQSATLSSIIARDPRPVRQLNPRVPRDLETIVLKCLMKDAGERYGTAEALGQDLRRFVRADPIEAKPQTALSRIARRMWRHRGKVSVAATFLVLVSVLVVYVVSAERREGELLKTERREGALHDVTKIVSLLDRGDVEAAYELALEIAPILPENKLLQDYIRGMTKTVHNLETEPAGAGVYWKPYGRPAVAWRFLGTTPLRDFRVRRKLCRWRIVKDGVGSIEFSLSYKDIENRRIDLRAAKDTPPGMVYVPGGLRRSLQLGGLYHFRVPAKDLEGFYIDRYEVTNREFKEFVDAGGYSEPTWWGDGFKACGVDEESRQSVMERFIDATARPGPAGWRHGTYADGRGGYPVTGVSWFEAVAYARYRKKRLPSIDHWSAAATPFHSPEIIPLSNIGEEREPAPVGRYEGMSGWGAYDMAGNVREWCWNDSGRGRYLLGGGSKDPRDKFSYADARNPYSRWADAGFRCVQLTAGTEGNSKLWEPLDLTENSRDYSDPQPMSDEEFEELRNDYAYDASRELDARVDEPPREGEFWIRERISFAAAYPGGERVPVVLFLPRGFRPPFQPIFICPSAGAWEGGSSQGEDLLELKYVRLLARSGRAVVYPISKETYERNTSSYYTWTPTEQRDVDYCFLKDYSRTIDYLQTRPDEFDMGRSGFFGNSAGAYNGPLILALERRFKAAVFKDGGLAFFEEHPHVDKVNFAPRVTIPVLMLNGEWDFVVPYRENQLPLFNLLGSAPGEKEHHRYSVVHGVPMNFVAEKTLEWFDRYLGVPRREAGADGAAGAVASGGETQETGEGR